MILFYWQKISTRRFSLVTRTSTILSGNPIKYTVQTLHLKSTEQRCPERMVIYPWKHSLLGTELPTRLRSSAELFFFYCILLYSVIFFGFAFSLSHWKNIFAYLTICIDLSFLLKINFSLPLSYQTSKCCNDQGFCLLLSFTLYLSFLLE